MCKGSDVFLLWLAYMHSNKGSKKCHDIGSNTGKEGIEFV